MRIDNDRDTMEIDKNVYTNLNELLSLWPKTKISDDVMIGNINESLMNQLINIFK